MQSKIIKLEDRHPPLKGKLQRIMRLIPDREKGDRKLKRLLAFRPKIDGESAIREYLLQNIKEIIQCSYTGSFYDFIKDDANKNKCNPTDHSP